MINKGFLLKDFVKSTEGEIKTANKSKKANIKIHGKGNLYFKNSENKIIKLPNVIAAHNLTDNLLSLRNFGEVEYGVYLDDTELKIFNRDMNENLITGLYQTPNWIINMDIQSNPESEKGSGIYAATVKLITLEDFLSQAQGESEGLISIHGELELGREEDQEITQEKSEIIGEDTEFGTNENNLDRKILDLNHIVSPKDREKLEKVQENSDPKENVKRISEGMIWHTRLGHASLEYLKQLQKSEEKLKKVKFDKEISECEICILAKMESLPFRDKRTRANRPLHTIPYTQIQ